MDELHTEYSLIGCIDGCKHRKDDVITREKRFPDIGQSYIAIVKTPVCAKNEVCSIYRFNIYQRADQEKEKLYTKLVAKGKDSMTALNRASKLWRKIADEYTTKPCPFHEPMD